MLVGVRVDDGRLWGFRAFVVLAEIPPWCARFPFSWWIDRHDALGIFAANHLTELGPFLLLTPSR